MGTSQRVTVEVRVERSAAQAWDAFTDPDAVTAWNFAAETWHCPRAESDLRVGGTFNYRMEARDASAGFDFVGTFTEVRPRERLRYRLGDGRDVTVDFIAVGARTRVIETFTAEDAMPAEQQKAGWQAILDNFKRFVEQRRSTT